MKHSVLIIAILAVFSACSANPETDRSGIAVNSSVPNSAVSNGNAAATNAGQTGGAMPYNGVQNINPNAFNATNDNLKVIAYQPKKDELPYGTRNAPDDSVVSTSSRGKEFVETRTFKNHELLAKVERIMDGKNEKYRIFLKNGKVLEAPAEKMGNFTALAPASILDAVGMLPKTAPIAPGKTEQKETQKP